MDDIKPDIDLIRQQLPFALLDYFDVNFFLIDKNGYYIYKNSVLNKIVGDNERADIIDAKAWDSCQQVMRDKEPKILEEEGFNGRWYLSTKLPYIQNNEVLGVIGIAIDITERKNLEKELKEAKAQAEAANQAKTQFLATVSHELRIPLTGVVTVANMMTENLISPEQLKKYAQIILDSGNYLLSNIEKILNYGTLEAEKVTLKKVPLNLQSQIESTTALLIEVAKNKGLNLSLVYPQDIPHYLISDVSALKHILINLIDNAIKYTEKGEITVSVRCVNQTQDSALIEISVKDTGIGIAENNFATIFEQFSQVEEAYVRKNSRSGLGLGLSIARKYAYSLGGNIHLSSQLGQGSTFYFTALFPLPKASSDEASLLPAGTTLKPNCTKQKNKPIKVLLIEDDKIVLLIEKELLSSLNCEVDTAINGSEAIKMATGEKIYDLIFSDIGLPDMTGNEAIKQIRHQFMSMNRETPIVAITGYVSEEEKKITLEAGANEVLAKPVQVNSLRDVIHCYLGVTA